MANPGRTAVAIAVLGAAGTVTAGWLGYQSGANAVNKDYVQMAVTNLDRKDASPELRKWSVDVLSKLSPVPFGKKLEDQLATGPIISSRIYQPRIDPPAEMMQRCPDIRKNKSAPAPPEQVEQMLYEYEVCRIRLNALLGLIGRYNELADRTEAEQTRRDKELGLPPG